MPITKLNLGCGSFKKKDYINVDINNIFNPDVLYDLNEFPYPFKDNEFDIIEISQCLEHLNKPFGVMKEIHRISKDGCIVTVKVPHFSRGYAHSEHKAGFDVSFPRYFDPEFRGYIGVNFKLKKMVLRWHGKNMAYLIKDMMTRYQFCIMEFVGKIIDFFANINVYLCSRIWCFWVGGFYEIDFQFISIKEG